MRLVGILSFAVLSVNVAARGVWRGIGRMTTLDQTGGEIGIRLLVARVAVSALLGVSSACWTTGAIAQLSILPDPALLPAQGELAHPGLADEVSAQQLLEFARSEQSTGRLEIAQRLFEQLIARFPNSGGAAQARRDLYAIYARDSQIIGPLSPAVAAAVPLPAPQVMSDRGNAGGWRTSLIARATLQDELRTSAGDRVFFGPGSAEVGDRARAVLTAQAVWLRRNTDVEVVVEGHSDPAETGLEAEALARARAEQVRFQLVAEGLSADRVRILSLGASQPVATCQEIECTAQNRRVVVRVDRRGPAAETVVQTSPAAARGPN